MREAGEEAERKKTSVPERQTTDFAPLPTSTLHFFIVSIESLQSIVPQSVTQKDAFDLWSSTPWKEEASI